MPADMYIRVLLFLKRGWHGRLKLRY